MPTLLRCVTTAVVVAVLSACTSSPPARDAASTPAASGSLTPSPSTGAAAQPVLTRAEAARRYQALAAADNAVSDRVRARCAEDSRFVTQGGSSDKTEAQRLANLRGCAVEAARSLRAFAAGLRAEGWPAEARSDIDDLARLSDAQAYTLERCAKAKTEDDYRTAMASLPQDDGSADLVRAHLGLAKR